MITLITVKNTRSSFSRSAWCDFGMATVRDQKAAGSNPATSTGRDALRNKCPGFFLSANINYNHNISGENLGETRKKKTRKPLKINGFRVGELGAETAGMDPSRQQLLPELRISLTRQRDLSDPDQLDLPDQDRREPPAAGACPGHPRRGGRGSRTGGCRC